MSTSSDARLGAIRLAWWRERLDELDHGKIPAEPRLVAIARELLRRNIEGRELSQLEDAWLPMLEPFPWKRPQALGLRLRGRLLFGIASRLLGAEPSAAEPAGEIWSLIDGAQHCSDRQSRDCLLGEARSVTPVARVPRSVRPVTIIAAVAVQDLGNASSGLRRGFAAAAHRLLGRMPSF